MARKKIKQNCPAKECEDAKEELKELQSLRQDAEFATSAYEGDTKENIGDFDLLTDKPDPKTGQILNDINLNLSDLKIQGTDFNAVVYRNRVDGSIVVAFQGTTSFKLWGPDMKANFDQARNKRSGENPTEYYNRAQQIARKIAKKLGQTPGGPRVRFVGHSLGGGLASAAARSIGGAATTLNSAGLNPNTVAAPVAGGQITAVSVRGEILTTAQSSTPIPKAAADKTIKLDPPLNVGRDMVLPLAATLSLGTLGLAASIAIRSGLLHRMPNVCASLDRTISKAESRVKSKCGRVRVFLSEMA